MSLVAHQLTLQAGTRTLVDSLDLALEPGEVLGILGANGAGKSTLISVLAGLAVPASGRVMLDGQALADLPPLTRAQHIGLLPQGDEGGFFGSVADFVALGHFPFGEQAPDLASASRHLGTRPTSPAARSTPCRAASASARGWRSWPRNSRVSPCSTSR